MTCLPFRSLIVVDHLDNWCMQDMEVEMHLCNKHMGVGQSSGVDTFPGDPDVWHGPVAKSLLFRTYGKACVESSTAHSFGVRWMDGRKDEWVGG